MKRNLEALGSRQFDVLVVGGGIHGALVAWDATLRGLSVALIERGDFGSATSQNSLKVIHGGLRYLQDGNLARIRTMARERTTWMRIAPHLVHPLTCVMPTQKKISRSRLLMKGALAMNGVLSFDRNRSMDPQKHLSGGRVITKQELSNLLTGYHMNGATGAAVWQDARIYNSERLLLEFILSAVKEGAQVANYVEATGFLQKEKRILGVHARDVLTGMAFDIQARVVINCAGAWTDELLGKVLAGSEYETSIAINVIVDQTWPDVAAGLASQPGDDRPSQILFFVPWRDKTMIGTFHIPWSKAPGEFRMADAVIQQFIRVINSAHPALKLTPEKIQHVTWGFLPVHKKDTGHKTVRLARDGAVIDHYKNDGFSGLISVIGVKYTTARLVAEQAVNLAASQLSEKTKKCQTSIVPVQGGWIGDFKAFVQEALAKTPRDMDEEIIEHLVYTYGSCYDHLAKDMIENPMLRERIDAQLPVTVAEIVHAVHHEMASSLLDVIQRRTELGATGLPSVKVLQNCAEVMGRELGWSNERQMQEIDCVIQAYPVKRVEGITA